MSAELLYESPFTGLRWIALGLVIATGCASDRTVTPERAPTRPGEVFESPTAGYSWRLPAECTFVPEELENARRPSAVDIMTATCGKDQSVSARVVVRSRLSALPGHWNASPDDLADLEELGVEVLEKYGAQVSGSQRIEMLGSRAMETNGLVEAERISVRLLYRGRRVFQFLCVGGEGTNWPCASAFAGFTIVDLPEPPADVEPRVLHLRDARFGLEFDAPDDSWLAIGPSTAMNGAQSVWIWRHASGEIHVQAADFSSLPIIPDAASSVARMAKHLESKGLTVTLKKAELAGMPCDHLQSTLSNGFRDVFVLNHDGINYALLVDQPKRDTKLIEKAKRGFRLTAR